MDTASMEELATEAENKTLTIDDSGISLYKKESSIEIDQVAENVLEEFANIEPHGLSILQNCAGNIATGTSLDNTLFRYYSLNSEIQAAWEIVQLSEQKLVRNFVKDSLNLVISGMKDRHEDRQLYGFDDAKINTLKDASKKAPGNDSGSIDDDFTKSEVKFTIF